VRAEGSRRRRTSPARRLRPFWLLAALAIVLAGSGFYALARWPALYPHAIEVSGNRVVSREAILAAARIDPQRNIWLQSARAMQTRIEAIPYVDVAKVHRLPPSTISIAITERVPYAFIDDVQQPNRRVTIDHAGRILQAGAPPELVNSLPAFALPLASVQPGVFIGAETAPLESVADALLGANLDARRLAFDRFGDVVVTLRSGVQVLLGDRTVMLGQKIAMVEPILEKVDRGRRKVAAIDLRAPTTPVVVYAK